MGLDTIAPSQREELAAAMGKLFNIFAASGLDAPAFLAAQRRLFDAYAESRASRVWRTTGIDS